MKAAKQQGQGALEYLLLIGGAVVVAVVVIFLLIGIAGSTGNAANSTVSSSFQHIQGVLSDGGEQQVSLCGNGDDTDPGEECDCGSGLTSCSYPCTPPTMTGSCTDCILSGC